MSNLKIELKDVTVEQLKDIAKQINIKGYSKLKKAELVELIVPVLLTPEVAYRIFLATESTELNLFMRVLKAPVTIANNIHIYDLNYLCNYGYFGVDDNNNIIIPDDVASLFNEIYTTKFKKEHKVYSYILQYINATVNLYGIVSPQKIVEIYNLQNENKIDDNLFFRLLLISVFREQYFELFAGYIVHESLLMENDEMVALIHRQGDKPFYIPEKEQLLKYADDLYIDETPEYEALRKGIREELKLSAELTEQLCENILLDCQMEEKLQSMINQFERRDISFRNTKQADKIIALIINLYNNARIWSNRGHTPNELFKKYDKPNLPPLPKEQLKFQKVGRNDPCPCGSGKKFKKCCGM